MNTRTRTAFFDELEKIAEEKKRHWAKDVAKGALGVGLGAGLGTGAALLAERKFPKILLEKHPQLVPAMKFILPTLGAATSYVQQRLRHRVDEEYKKAPGYRAQE